MIIQPYSTAETFDATDYPALKHFWHCKQDALPVGSSAASYVTDVAGGASFLVSAGAAKSGNGLVIPASSTYTTLLANLIPPENKPCILIACADWGATTAGMIYGSTSATGGLNVGNASSGARVFDGTNTAIALGTQTPSASFTRVATVDATQIMMLEVNASTLDVYTNVLALASATPGAITAVNAVANQVGFPTADVTLYGAAFFKFDSVLPPKEVIQAAAAWLDYQWRNNSEVTMYPGFKGLA